jgi:hypothetical protein
MALLLKASFCFLRLGSILGQTLYPNYQAISKWNPPGGWLVYIGTHVIRHCAGVWNEQ